MRRYNQLYKLAFVIFALATAQSCKKSNGIDNNTVIKKPYGLYIGSNTGELLATNDGLTFKTVFGVDRFPYRSIITSGPTNLLFVKGNVHLSENNGQNFNPTYLQYATPGIFAPWQSLILNVADHGRIYLSSMDPATRGIVYSEDNGKRWKADGEWEPGAIGGAITSFAQLSNGTLFSFSDANDSLYVRGDKNAKWTHYPQTKVQPTGMSYLSHFNNTLLLTDYNGPMGVQYSNDSGKIWTKYPGLPNRKLRVTHAPFGRVLLVGTDSMGVYRLENGKFVPSINGLETNTTVYSIVGKEDIYKNSIEKKYIYIATNRGLYRSEDLGFSWALMLEGDFGALY
ncbi:MAG TPA: hypothetical protein PL009_00030 [Flavipsychrobacter sp.]|nr:hypothetical protein [Flavipsychrobacter sp.]